MTEEQIRPIAENYVEEFCLDPDDEYTSGSLVCAGIGTALIVARTLEKQNEELKEKLESSEKSRDYWKESAFDWRHKFFEKRSTKRLVKKSKQLAKAKEIIKSFSEFVNNEVEYDPEHLQEHTDLWVKLCEQAEQFLKEVSE